LNRLKAASELVQPGTERLKPLQTSPSRNGPPQTRIDAPNRRIIRVKAGTDRVKSRNEAGQTRNGAGQRRFDRKKGGIESEFDQQLKTGFTNVPSAATLSPIWINSGVFARWPIGLLIVLAPPSLSGLKSELSSSDKDKRDE
jgi:hypothetical protein